MNKILITGYMHSGTTMLMQLMRAHPQVGWIEMEQGYIEYPLKNRDWIITMAKKKVPDMDKFVWGDKLPWGHRQGDETGARVIEITRRWLKLFKKEGRVIHIIRHPLDVASSGRPDGNPGNETLEKISSSLPKYIDYINQDSRIASIIYEDLLLNPKEHLTNLFHYCGLKSSEKIINGVIKKSEEFGGIKKERAYAHKHHLSEKEFNIDYKKTLERLYVRL